MKDKVVLKASEAEVQEKYTMKAGIIKSPGEIIVEEIPMPKPKRGEVRIKLKGSGLCASNLPVWEGRDWFDYPIEAGNPGHEGWGIIDEVGEGVEQELIGKSVTGLSYHAFAHYDIAKLENIVLIPEKLADKPFPGEPLGCVMNIYKRSEISSKDKVAVIGCGFLGLALIQLLKSKGCEVIAISRRDFSLEMAGKMGADHLVQMDDHQRIIDTVKDITKGNFCDKTIECTGIEWPLNLGIEITGIRGKLIVAGFHQDGMRSLNVQMLNWRGIDMISAHERNPENYISGIKKAVRAIEEQKFDPFKLFTHRFSLEEINKGFTFLKERPDGFIKAILTYENFD